VRLRCAVIATAFFVTPLAACASHGAEPMPAPSVPAPAPKPLVPVVVIDLDADEASDDQADALTAALRARIANVPGWRLDASRPSMTLLSAALRCPHPPDSACLKRIGDQLETDHYIWGVVTKAPTQGDVVAEVHYWSRGEIEQAMRQTYSDNLTDQNDDALRRIALQMLQRLSNGHR
jgi:hypothetical protein